MSATEPVRTCIGCLRKAGQPALVRFVADGGRLVPGTGRPGRGAWLCRSTLVDCFDRASSRGRWARALRTPVDGASVIVLREQLASGSAPVPLG